MPADRRPLAVSAVQEPERLKLLALPPADAVDLRSSCPSIRSPPRGTIAPNYAQEPAKRTCVLPSVQCRRSRRVDQHRPAGPPGAHDALKDFARRLRSGAMSPMPRDVMGSATRRSTQV